MPNIAKPKNETLYSQIATILSESRKFVVNTVNTAMVRTYFEIGRIIVENEQNGNIRAEYGKETLKNLSVRLTKDFGKGFSVTNLKQMREFYLVYATQIPQTVSAKSRKIRQTPSDEFNDSDNNSSTLLTNFELSWSHYLFLMRIDNPDERSFYEIESKKSNWSLRELRRQFDSALYERLALSKDKAAVKELSQKGVVVSKPEDIVKDPYILEFLGLPEHYRVDLVFYNRLLQCFVLIDLKIGKLTHQDLGQIQMYVNYYDRFVKLDHENKTIGIVLCKNKNDALVEITLPEDNTQIFASKYETVLPDKEVLKKLIED